MGPLIGGTNDDCRAGYQVAVNLTTHEEQALWQRCSVMIVANSALIALAGLSIKESIKLFNWLSLALVASFAGMILCFIWMCLVARSSIKAVYWIKKAAELEGELDGNVKTLAEGNLWESGKLSKEQCVQILGKDQPLRRHLSNVIQVKEAAFMFAGAFLVIQLLMFIASIWQMLDP